MKKLIFLIFVCGIFYFVYTNRDGVIEYILRNFINKNLIVSYENNIYYKNNDQYLETDNFYPNKKEDIINIFYTALNGGWNNVVFFCTTEYEGCLDDVAFLANNSKEFNKVNNYVHPYNSYRRIILNYNNLGKVEIVIEKLYSEEDITSINFVVEKVISEYTKETMNNREKIMAIHDYIINNTFYDEESAEKVKNNVITDFTSSKANGSLINGKAICGGYSDAMAVFLDKLNITNYKLASDVHIWNYVFLDNNWYHLDLTWDDPINDQNTNVLLHNFFLITDSELKKLDTKEHNYY